MSWYNPGHAPPRPLDAERPDYCLPAGLAGGRVERHLPRPARPDPVVPRYVDSAEQGEAGRLVFINIYSNRAYPCAEKLQSLASLR